MSLELNECRENFELATEAHQREIKGLTDASKQVYEMKESALQEVGRKSSLII